TMAAMLFLAGEHGAHKVVGPVGLDEAPAHARVDDGLDGVGDTDEQDDRDEEFELHVVAPVVGVRNKGYGRASGGCSFLAGPGGGTGQRLSGRGRLADQVAL